jgi:NAD(P)-dependent dehydrogenase (short-subunit alcohol dehydrogenase family)
VKAAGAEPLIIDIDLSEVSAAKTLVDQALAAFGRVDALLNIAGAVPQIDLFEMSGAQWDGGLALKLHGARRLTNRDMAGVEGSQGFGRVDVGEFGAVPQGALRCRRGHQRGDRGARQGLFGSGHRRRRPGQQRSARPGDDRPPLAP